MTDSRGTTKSVGAHDGGKAGQAPGDKAHADRAHGDKTHADNGAQVTSSCQASASAQAPGATGQVLSSSDDAVVRRTKDGWRVGGVDLPDLTSAMVLADLLAAELAATEATPDGAPGTSAAADASDQSKEPAGSETSRLRATISQLEHALAARVRVEQAIGVLAERHRIQPRQAFEQLRSAARSRGRRVIDIATDVVASATNPLLQLPDELSRPRSAGRRAAQPRGLLGSE